MNPRTITSTLIAVVIVLQLISLAAVTQSKQARLDDQARHAAVNELDTKAKSLVVQAQQFLSPITSQLSISRQLIADGLLNAADNAYLERYFLSQLRSNSSMNALYLGRYDGSFVAVARFEQSLLDEYQEPVLRSKVVSVVNGERRIEWREYSLRGKALNQWTDHADTYDPRVRAWYQNAQGHERPVWTNAFSLNDSNKLAIAASVNLRNQRNKDVGVLGVSVELSQLSALVSSIPSASQSSAVVLDNKFNEIAVSTPYSLQATNSDDFSLAVNSDSNVTRLPKLSPPVDAHGNQLSAVDMQWFSKDNTVANVQRRIELFDGSLQWRVLLQTPVTELSRAQTSVIIEGLYRTMAIILLPGILALLVIFALGERIQRLHRRATIDFLTRALNREEFMSRFSKRIASDALRPDKGGQWIAVALDLDGFKQINDQHGHDAGDVILQTVVNRLQQRVGRSGFVGRLGGDEFAVALKLQRGMNAQAAVETIRRSVVSGPVKSAHAVHHIGMTAGIAKVGGNDSVAELLERADRALIAGKAIAKNTSYCANENVSVMRAANANEYRMVNRLKARA